MRGAAIAIVLLLSMPAAVGLGPAFRAPPVVDSLPMDIGDGDLLLQLAKSQGWHVTRPSPVNIPQGLTLAIMVERLAARLGVEAAPADFEVFERLDPRVEWPVLTMLVAIDEAWTIRDAAYEDMSREDLVEMDELMRSGDHTNPRFAELAAMPDLEALIGAAILLLDTAEGVVIPAIQEAVAAGVWPPVPVADPVGVLRIGSSGNDIEAAFRLLQIDPTGDDVYLNNAGGATLVGDIDPFTPDYPVAMSIDLAGNDSYVRDGGLASMGASNNGIGILLELSGSDSYLCESRCLGYSGNGVGFLRDFSGDDTVDAGELAAGAGGHIGVYRDDTGSDHRTAGDAGLGYGLGKKALGLLWDRAGADTNLRRLVGGALFGYGQEDGQGLYVDEGADLDAFRYALWECNDCTWAVGRPEPTGRGNDNRGGLATILAGQ